jgi:hypothetical protein
MWLFADVLEDSPGILSKVVVDSPKMKFAKLVVLILIVKLGKVIGLFVGVKKIILVTHFKDVEENVNLVEIVQHNKNAFNSDVWQLVVKELVEKMLIAKRETIEHNVNVPQIS